MLWSKRHVKRVFHHVFTFGSTEYFLTFSLELRIVEVGAVPADVSDVMVRASALTMLAMLSFWYHMCGLTCELASLILAIKSLRERGILGTVTLAFP